MFGPDEVISNWSAAEASQHGLAPRAIQSLFTSAGSADIHCSYVEVYNDQVNDLLGARKNLSVRDKPKGVAIEGLTLEKVTSLQQTMEAVGRGNGARVVAGMKMNARSSRGHAILTLSLQERSDGVDSSGSLVLVDLAGMELSLIHI